MRTLREIEQTKARRESSSLIPVKLISQEEATLLFNLGASQTVPDRLLFHGQIYEIVPNGHPKDSELGKALKRLWENRGD